MGGIWKSWKIVNIVSKKSSSCLTVREHGRKIPESSKVVNIVPKKSSSSLTVREHRGKIHQLLIFFLIKTLVP